MRSTLTPSIRHRPIWHHAIQLRAVRHHPMLTLLCLTALLASCTHAPPAGRAPAQPEGASGITAKPGWAYARQAVAAANPLATEAGAQVLQAGGSALDAAIAVQMVLTLVEPQSSGIGGGAFLLHWDGRQVQAFDGRETAPADTNERLFLKADGTPMAFIEGVVGGRSVGVPGTLRMLEMAHRQHGRLPWARLFQPAIDLAERGFEIGPRLHTLLKADAHLKKDPVAASYFYEPDGQAKAVGTVLRNPELAAVLHAVALGGADAFYTGTIARDVVAKVRGHATNPGRLSEQDLSDYRPKTRDALCSDWRALRLCGFPPPSSGHIAIAQILGMLEHAPVPTQALGSDGTPHADFVHAYTEAARLAFADRALYVADLDFVAPPAGSWHSLLDPRLPERARDPDRVTVDEAGQARHAAWCGGVVCTSSGTAGTRHLAPVGCRFQRTRGVHDHHDRRRLWRTADGARLLVEQRADGLLVCARRRDGPAHRQPRAAGQTAARSSMSPTLVFDRASGQLLASAGSPGGALIIHYTAKTLLGLYAWGLNAQQAVALPNFGSTNGPTLLEEKRFPAATLDALKARGHEVREMPMTSGLQAIQRTSTGWFGGADPRREGVVMGE